MHRLVPRGFSAVDRVAGHLYDRVGDDHDPEFGVAEKKDRDKEDRLDRALLSLLPDRQYHVQEV